MLHGECHEAEASEASLTLNNAAWVIVTVSIQGCNTRFAQSILLLDFGWFQSPVHHEFGLLFGYYFCIYLLLLPWEKCVTFTGRSHQLVGKNSSAKVGRSHQVKGKKASWKNSSWMKHFSCCCCIQYKTSIK